MSKQMRNLVKSGYNEGHYERNNKTPENFEKALCDEMISRIKPNSKILDLGCGIGLPYDKYFFNNNLSVTGIDISKKHIEQAKKNVKNAKFFVGDFFSENIKEKFDAISSFYAIFHIPRKEHKKLFEHIHSLLKKDGMILITLGAEPMKCDIDKNFAGAPMAWSSYSVEKNKRLVKEAGFKILIASEDYRTEKHLWILAKKR